jgi:hypothetical protein
MKNPFTIDDLILSDFCETCDSDKMKTSGLIRLDSELRQEMSCYFEELSNSVSPDSRIVSNVLSYSRALCVLPTKSNGNINMLMN